MRKHRARDREGLPPLWDVKRPGRVSQDFLAVLNRESTRMSAHLQDPGNWAGIMQAAQAARGRISGLEAELGLERFGTIGPGGPLSQEEYEDLFAGRTAPVVEPVTPVTRVTLAEVVVGDAELERVRALRAAENTPQVTLEYPETRRQRIKRLLKTWKVLS
jgi:hypothetical protein